MTTIQVRKNSINDLLSTTRGKTYTVIVVTIITIVLMVAMAIVPAYLSISNRIKENAEKKAYVEELTKQAENLKALIDQEEQYVDQINLLNGLFPDRRNDEFQVANLTQIAERYNVTFSGVTFNTDSAVLQPSDLNQFPNLVVIPMNFSVSGNLENLQFFLAHIEAYPAVVRVKAINYGLQTEEGEEQGVLNQYTMIIEAEYYHFNYEEFAVQ